MAKPFKKLEQNLADDKDFRHIVRVVNTDLKGEKKLIMALQKIKGISYMFSNFVCYSAKVDPFKIAGHLADDEVKRLEDVIKNPAKYKCPSWMLNRRKDYETGQDMHLFTTELDLSVVNRCMSCPVS